MSSRDEVRKPHVRGSQVFRKERQPELFPVSVEDLLPEKDLSRLIRSAIDELDASSLRSLYGEIGGVAYDPLCLLGVLLLGYGLGVTGSRELQARCQFDVRFMHVARGTQPDDRTICRFRRRIAPMADQLFCEVLALCAKAGLAPMRRVAVDGSKLASASSQLGQWMNRNDKVDKEFMGDEIRSSDPDARILHTSKGAVLGYNVQACVDVDTHLVLAVDVVDAGCDRSSLAPMLELTQAVTGWSPEEVVADTGYDSHEAYSACHEAGVDVYVPPQNSDVLFWTVVSENEVVCPLGHPALPAKKRKSHGALSDTYQVRACKTCAFALGCLGEQTTRSIVLPRGNNPTLRVLAAHRARSPEGQIARVERMSSVETLFGRIKSNLRMRRFKLRGMNGARLEITLTAISQNLRALHRTRLLNLRSLSVTYRYLLQLFAMDHKPNIL